MLRRFKFLIVLSIVSISIAGFFKGALALPPPPNYIDSWTMAYNGATYSEGRFHVSSYSINGSYLIYSTNTNYTSCLIFVSFRNADGIEISGQNILRSGTSTKVNPGIYTDEDTRCSFSFDSQGPYVNNDASFIRVSGCAVTTSDDCQQPDSAWVTFTDLEVNIPPTSTPIPTTRPTRTITPSVTSTVITSVTPSVEPSTDNTIVTPEITNESEITPTAISNNDTDNLDVGLISGISIIVPVAIGTGILGILVIVSIPVIAKMKKPKIATTPATSPVAEPEKKSPVNGI